MAEAVSTNVRGAGQRWLSRLNTSEVHDCIFDVTHEVLVERTKKAAEASTFGPGVPVNFSLAIDATNLEKVLEVSASHKEIIGGAPPKYVFDISDLPKDDVNTVITGTSTLVKINKAKEVKVTDMSFQLTAAGVPPIVIVAA